MSEDNKDQQVASNSNPDSIASISQTGEGGESDIKEEKMKMSVEDKRVEAQTEKKPAGDDAVVLLGKKVEEYTKKLDSVITKMESIEQELGKVKVPEKQEVKKQPEPEPEEDEVEKEEACPAWAKSMGSKLDELVKWKKSEEEAKLKLKKEVPEDKEPEKEPDKEPVKEEAKKKAKKEPVEDDEEESSDDEELDAKKKVKGAKIEDATQVTAVSTAWFEEIKEASKKYFPDI